MHNMLLNKVKNWGLWGVPASWLQGSWTLVSQQWNSISVHSYNVTGSNVFLKTSVQCHVWTAISDVAFSLSWYVTLTSKLPLWFADLNTAETSTAVWDTVKKLNLSGQCKQGQILPYGISHGVNYIMMHALTRDLNSSSSQVSQRQNIVTLDL